MSKELIVAGFHRSGTSMASQLLHQAGVFLGDDLVGAIHSNPYGHFEDRRIMQLHDAILRDNGHNWQVAAPFVPTITPQRWQALREFVVERRTAHTLWGFKDPRVCLFLGAWKHLLPGARILIVFRSVVDSAFSLERRHATQYFSGEGPEEIHLRFWREPDLALRMWLVYNEALLRAAAEYPDDVVAVSFDLLARGFPLIDHIDAAWDLGLTSVPTHEVFDASVTQQRSYPMTVTDETLIDEALDMWRRLRELEARTALGKDAVDAA